ncbi:MAG TPA: ATP synthase A1 subunit C [Thermoplasmata archaeon]|nr:ATP synthase A1 subunit C [Thermoplasmata archaeon]
MAIPSLQGVSDELRDRVMRRYRWIRERIPIETGNYPYVTARVKAKRASLLPQETYERLLLMELPEIARFLGEREYKAQMLALGAKYSGVDLIEYAVSRNLAETYNRIYEFSEGSLRAMVGRYLDRYDLENIKTIVRAKTYGASVEEVEEDLISAGSFSEEFLDRLVEMPSLDEVFEELSGTIYAAALGILKKKPSQVTNWSEWEDLVSRLYYAQLLASIPPATEANRFMREFIQREIDILNLKTLLRAWTAKATFEREIFLEGGYELPVDELRELVTLDKPALVRRLQDYSFYEDIADALEKVEESGIGVLVRRVEKIHLLGAARYAHLHPLSILPILDFIVRKDREAINIRLIARGKESGLPLGTIRDLLVV